MSIAVFTSLQQLCDNAGDPLSGGSVTVYEDGTTTLIQLYNAASMAGGTQTGNPITLDAYGRHAITYFATQAYKVLVQDSNGATIFTRDNIDPGVPVGTGALPIANGGTAATNASTALTNLGGATAAELAALAVDVAAITGSLASTEKSHIATGTTAQRPASPAEGDIRRNTTTALWEGFVAAWQNFATCTRTTTEPTYQIFTTGTSQTYTTPAGVKWIRVRAVAGGGGGGASNTNSGGTGGTTDFNSIAATGGSGGIHGASTGNGGAGGTGGAGSATLRIIGSDGDRQSDPVSGRGGDSALGGSAGSGSGAGAAGKTNTGGGGSGAGGAGASGGGGGGGEYFELVIASPAANYTYSVGGAGTAGAAGGTAGGAGAAGRIIVEEYYV